MCVGIGFPLTVAAKNIYASELPNGLVASEGGCNLCHQSGGGTPRNPFGLAVQGYLPAPANDDTYWLGTIWGQIHSLDSDGDGYSNGTELGDPDGDGVVIDGWKPTRPGFLTDTPCGSGTIEQGIEVCDGADLGSQSCDDFGFPHGTLTCASSCQDFIESGCSDTPVEVAPPPVVEPNEESEEQITPGVQQAEPVAESDAVVFAAVGCSSSSHLSLWGASFLVVLIGVFRRRFF